MTSEIDPALFQMALEASASAVIVTDYRQRDNPIVYVNGAAEQLTGYGREEMLGRNPRFLQRNDHAQDQLDEIRIALHMQEPVKAVLRNYRKDGERYLAEIHISPIFDGDGNVTHFVAIQNDVTEQKAALRDLRESEERLRSIMEAESDAIITIDEQGIIASFSHQAEAVFGYRADEVVGKNVHILMPSHDRDRHNDYLAAYLKTGEKKIIGIGRDVIARRRDGSEFPIFLAVNEMLVGKQRMFTGVIRDISEQRAYIDQLHHAQKLEAVGQLTGGIAHDFNNLLTVISGNLELLEMRLDLDDQRRGYLTEAQDAVDLGAELTARLLAFARRQPLKPRVIDVNELVLDMRDLLQRTIGQNIQVSTLLSGELQPTVADPGQLQNALLNLAINARDAMPNGGRLTIETAMEHVDPKSRRKATDLVPGTYVSLTVADTGEGMSADVKEHAFEPFFTTKEAGVGSGLGLSMIYGFAKQSDGDVVIESEPGEGAKVTLYLPQITPAEVGDQSAPAPDLASAKGEKILVVEDDPRVLRVTVDRLRALGYQVHSATNAAEALTRLESDSGIHLLFSDVMMPGDMSGIDLAEVAQRRYPDLRVLLVSGFVPDLSGSVEAASPEFVRLNKPYKQGELAKAVREILED